jgi:hypothetical protein
VRTLSFELNVVQSVPVRAPVVVALAFQIENTPVVLLYEREPSAEREVSPIFVATTHEREARFEFVSARLPERVFTVHERVAMFPVAVAIFEFVVARLVVRLVILVVLVAVCPERVATEPERVETVVVRLVIFVFIVAKFHERVETFPERVAIFHVAVARFESWSVFVP